MPLPVSPVLFLPTPAPVADSSAELDCAPGGSESAPGRCPPSAPGDRQSAEERCSCSARPGDTWCRQWCSESDEPARPASCRKTGESRTPGRSSASLPPASADVRGLRSGTRGHRYSGRWHAAWQPCARRHLRPPAGTSRKLLPRTWGRHQRPEEYESGCQSRMNSLDAFSGPLLPRVIFVHRRDRRVRKQNLGDLCALRGEILLIALTQEIRNGLIGGAQRLLIGQKDNAKVLGAGPLAKARAVHHQHML